MRPLITTTWGLALVLAGSADGAPARRDTRPPPGDRAEAAAEEDRRDGPVMDTPTAEDVLKALLKQRPPNEVIAPDSAALRNPSEAPRTLLPEGSSLVDRTGTIEYQAPWWKLVADAPEAAAPLKLLPNATLERMVRTTRGATAPVVFVVSGEMTVYSRENYLLPRAAMRVVSEQESDEPGAEETALPPDASAKDVLNVLKVARPKKRVIPSDDVSPGDSAAGAPNAGSPVLLDGTPFVNRPGRIVREDPWWAFALESDHPDHLEPPLRLLPNKNVELMVEAARRGESGLVFVVSGEVTAYGGENFLLPRVAMRRIDLGNLRK